MIASSGFVRVFNHGCPEKIGHRMDCSNNLLESMEYGPKFINDMLNCGNNKLTSFFGFPEKITDSLGMLNNLISKDQLKYFDTVVNGIIIEDFYKNDKLFLVEVNEQKIKREKEILLSIKNCSYKNTVQKRI